MISSMDRPQSHDDEAEDAVELLPVVEEAEGHHENDPCVTFLLGKKVDTTNPTLPKNVRDYAKNQNLFIDQLISLHDGKDEREHDDEASAKCGLFRTSSQAATWSLVANICLLVVKIAAFAFSGSLSIIATVIDSAIDLLAGVVLFLIARGQTKREPNYPVGKKRFEPLGVIFVACVMGSASFQVILVSVQSMIETPTPPVIDIITLALVVAVIATKSLLYIACRVVPSSSAQALAADHFNDVISNIVVIFALLVADRFTIYGDGIGAILVSLFIINNWVQQGMEHVRNLSSHAAPNNLLQKATWVASHHCEDILSVDTVRGYSFGSDCFMEVDIVLPEKMPLYIAHDIGESLQLRLEKIEGVERAFVHLDFRTDHKASDEHRDNYNASREHSSTLSYSHIRAHGPLIFGGAYSVAHALSDPNLASSQDAV